MKLCSKFVKAVGIDGVTHFFHELQVIIEIVDRAQLRAQNFADPIQVMQVGPGKMTAGITLAGFYRALRMRISPKRVNSQPFRALRVGMTQSNMSIPLPTPATRSSGVPTPIR